MDTDERLTPVETFVRELMAASAGLGLAEPPPDADDPPSDR